MQSVFQGDCAERTAKGNRQTFRSTEIVGWANPTGYPTKSW